MREFIYVDDLVKGIIHILENYKNNGPINLGSGFEVSINELANTIASVIGYEGQTKFDITKPDGMKRKILDSSKIQKLGWNAKTSLYEGIEKTYSEFLKKIN